jgi:hypothetical protein
MRAQQVAARADKDELAARRMAAVASPIINVALPAAEIDLELILTFRKPARE